MSEQQLIKHDAEFLANIAQREEWLKSLNSAPEQVQKNNGFDSIPISVLETMLDETYLGAWQTSNFRYQVIANEIVGTIDLKVFDPQLKKWLTRSGSAAAMIRQTKDSAITDIGAKIKNGLMMDFPKLESMCLKAACKRLGAKFGRNLNRKFEDEYETIYTNEAELEPIKDVLNDKLAECKTVEELKAVWANLEEYHNNPRLKAIFNSRKLKLQHNGK